MKKYFLKLQSYFKRKSYKEDPSADFMFASKEPDFKEPDINTTAYSTSDNPSTTNFIADLIAELKKAEKEVQEFEHILKSIKQNTTV